MLTAKEALKIYNNSLHTLEKYLNDNFHSGIRQAAGLGLRRYVHHMGEERHRLPELSALEKKALEELIKLGFNAQYLFYGEAHVSRDLADDDGNGTSHKNYGIVVTW